MAVGRLVACSWRGSSVSRRPRAQCSRVPIAAAGNSGLQAGLRTAVGMGAAEPDGCEHCARWARTRVDAASGRRCSSMVLESFQWSHLRQPYWQWRRLRGRMAWALNHFCRCTLVSRTPQRHPHLLSSGMRVCGNLPSIRRWDVLRINAACFELPTLLSGFMMLRRGWARVAIGTWLQQSTPQRWRSFSSRQAPL